MRLHSRIFFTLRKTQINAAKLKKRKRRYQREFSLIAGNNTLTANDPRIVFLAQLVFVILFLTSDVLLDTSFLILPVNLAVPHLDEKIRIPFLKWWFGQSDWVVPQISTPVIPHPYVIPGVWLVAVTTLILFFASGLYSEKILYANRYVPQANRALRSFNIHLNVRTQPKGPPAPLKYLFPRPPPSPRHQPQPPPTHSVKSSAKPNTTRNQPPGRTHLQLTRRPVIQRSIRTLPRSLGTDQRRWLLGWLPGSKAAAPNLNSGGRNTPTPASSRPASRRSSPAGGVRRNRARTPDLTSSPLAQGANADPGRTTPRLSTVPEAVDVVQFPTSPLGETRTDEVLPGLERSRTESFSFLLQRQDSSGL
ncbi:Spo7 domain protein [Ceratobasidium sp. AG-Ba]|nr:Spo7 domain protein [Ceratobasidium sp. AG-Ba]